MEFGCLKEIPSLRNYEYEIVYGAPKINLPDSYILPEDRLPKIRNQGYIGACVAFACVEIMEVLNRIEFGTDKTFSAGFFYGYNRDDGENIVGMYPSRALKHFRKTGSVPTIVFDELKEMPEMKALVKDKTGLAEIAEKYRIKGYTSIPSPQGNVKKVKQAIYQARYPLLAVSDTYFGGSHAIIIIGYEKDGFIIQNSWGKNWGENGRKKVPYDAINYVYILTDEVFEMKFTDVPKDKWYHDAVKETVFNGLMQGTGEETFDPEKPLTRAEMAQILVNLCKKLDDALATKQ
ncbi:MAG: hypothetical protein E7408_03235 [Ruminococcaceae bacterium]|nr:hypothetical protein [Oscillospiraceae bacterium]